MPPRWQVSLPPPDGMGCAASAPAADGAALGTAAKAGKTYSEALSATSLKRLQQELWQCAAPGALWDDYELGPVIGATPRPRQPASPLRRACRGTGPRHSGASESLLRRQQRLRRRSCAGGSCSRFSGHLPGCKPAANPHALLAKGSTGYSERDCRTAFTALLRALCYLHARGVTHRDVKLDNVLLAAPGDLTTVRLVDFGLAASCLAVEPDAPEPAMTWMCGSAPYMAPEVALRRIPYTDACDMWSAGVVLHLLLTGHMPFAAPAGTPPEDEDEAVLAAAKSVHWAVTCDAPEWTGVSNEAKALARALLQPEPGQRLSAAQALLHPWVSGDVASGGADLSGALSRLTRFVAIADLPSVKLPPGTLLTADGSVGGSLFAIDGGVFLIKTGTVDVLVPADDASPNWPPSSASSADDGMRPMRRVGSRGAGELVGELSMMHVDGAGKVTWGAHHAAGEGSGRHALTPSLSRKSSGVRQLSATNGAAGEAGSVHGSSAGGSRHAAGGDGSGGDAPNRCVVAGHVARCPIAAS